MNYTVDLLMSQFVTHDVKHFIVSKPEGFSVVPGQGVELAINRPNLSGEGRPFTPTSLADDRVLEFTIKGYSDHPGVTQALHQLEPGAELRCRAVRHDQLSAGRPSPAARHHAFLAILRSLRAGSLDVQT
jgi:ferredoxin-NADP reductase